MKSNLKDYAEHFLFALNIFILFLLVFENRLSIPPWLQPLGRMHPMLLHFPIVMLLLAMALEFFRFKPQYQQQPFYQSFTSGLWLSGILFSALTILMGLFLSKEGGYEGAALQWHKWLGIGLLFFTTAIYASRQAAWYQARIARASALVTTCSLVFVGHYGAVLTHGQNFVLEPVTGGQTPSVPLQQALVFDHLVQPILEKKCVSCHNPDKIKGRLILTSAEAMQKGGKSGKLWEAGKPELSLLLKRIHLPLEDKKHMPPANKVQLSPEEIRLLTLWIRADASFNIKVVDLPAGDSLRMLATTLLQSGEEPEQYDFAAADEQTIQKLSNNYRVIAPLAQASPALAVNFYSKQAYSAGKLAELKEIRQQIVSLELNKMPVKDADLKNISSFVNLRRLNLNFTDITGSGLKELAALKDLELLALSGTKISYQDLQKLIGALPNLKSLALWNTPIAEADIRKLQRNNKSVSFILGFKDDGSQLIRLNPPQIKNSAPIFRQTLPLLLHHPIKGVTIRYTTDGSEPDSTRSPVFKSGTILSATTTIKAKAFKPGWFGSDVAVFPFYKSAFKPDSVRLLYPLNQVHQASGARTFFDGELGAHNANSPAWANNWAGVYKNDMALFSAFKQPVELTAIGLNTLIESENNIFPPATVEVWGGTSKDQLQLITTFSPAQPRQAAKPIIQLIENKFKPHRVSYLKIVARPLKELPEWHRGKGKPALLLVDEIFLN